MYDDARTRGGTTTPWNAQGHSEIPKKASKSITRLRKTTVYGKIPATLPATYDTRHPSGAYYSLIFVGKFTILFFFAAFFQIPENGGAYYSVFAYRSMFAYHSTTAYCSTTFNKLNLQYLSI